MGWQQCKKCVITFHLTRMKITTTISEPSGLTRWFESLAVFFSWGYSVLQLSLSCFICSELTADLLRSSNVSRFQQLVRLDLSSTYLYIVPPSRRSSSELVNRGCVDVASNQPMANMQKSDHYTQYKNLVFVLVFVLSTATLFALDLQQLPTTPDSWV